MILKTLRNFNFARVASGVPLILTTILVLMPGTEASAQTFEYKVRHKHLLRDCHGVLTISADGAEYKSGDTKDSRVWKLNEIRFMKIESAREISFVTYEDQKRYFGKDRVFEFTVLEGTVKPDLSEFLLRQLKRPAAIAVLPEGGNPVFELRVKHLHSITGALGTLKVYDDRVEFQSRRVGDSRSWRISDIDRFSQPDRYRFQIVSFEPKAAGPTEVYNFQLMDDLPPGLYDFLWTRLHPSLYYPTSAGAAKPGVP